MANYVRENIEAYIMIVLDFCDNAILDDEQVALDVLNYDDLGDNTKLAYLAVLKTKIANISAVNFIALWNKILNLDLCENSQENILAYFEQHGLNDTLIKFINSHEALSYDGEDIRTEKLLEKFFDAIIIANDIADDRYSLILTSIDLYYDAFDIVNISKSKLDILIDNKIIRMTTDTLPFIRKNYPNNLIRYIEKNIAEYVALMTDELFRNDEVLNVLKLNVADDKKISLLKFTDESISVLNKGYTDTVKAYILDNNFYEDDLSGIITQYSSEADSVKAVIESITVDKIDNVLENEIVPPISLFDVLLTNAELTDEYKLGLFALIVGNLEKDQFRNYLPQLKIDYYDRVFERGQPQIPNTPTHEQILIVLQRKGWISSFKADDRDDDYFRAYGWKPHKKKVKRISHHEPPPL